MKKHKLYGRYQVLPLNLMLVQDKSRRKPYTVLENLILFLPFLVGCLLLVVSVLGNLTFLAECQNIAGGDICSIRVSDAQTVQSG